MSSNNPYPERRPNPRRKRRKPMQIFLESYLPIIILLLIVVLIVVFIVSGSNRRKQQEADALASSIAASQSEAAQQEYLEFTAQELIARAKSLADAYDYEGAIAVLDSFPGNIYDHDALLELRDQCTEALSNVVTWDNLNDVLNLSFHMLIADPSRAFKDANYGNTFRKDFITVDEFKAILQQLYDNGYVLVDPADLLTPPATGQDNGYPLYSVTPISLPAGKKPLILTQTQPNYYTYTVDSDGDGLADKNGSGFASRLILDQTGNFTCEMVAASGNTLTGQYDMVPILENFIRQHPDFSYNGARAVLAVSGYDGLFGYRTDPETVYKISEDYHKQQLTEVVPVLDKLKKSGYTLACYTYRNVAYGNLSANEIRSDLDKWKAEVTPLLGETDILVYAKESDISDPATPYNGEKYDILKEAGFRYFVGVDTTAEGWSELTKEYVRQGRLTITGRNLENNPDLYTGIFDASAVLDSARK